MQTKQNFISGTLFLIPDKKLLREKLHEFFLQNEAEPSKISERL